MAIEVEQFVWDPLQKGSPAATMLAQVDHLGALADWGIPSLRVSPVLRQNRDSESVPPSWLFEK